VALEIENKGWEREMKYEGGDRLLISIFMILGIFTTLL